MLVEVLQTGHGKGAAGVWQGQGSRCTLKLGMGSSVASAASRGRYAAGCNDCQAGPSWPQTHRAPVLVQVLCVSLFLRLPVECILGGGGGMGAGIVRVAGGVWSSASTRCAAGRAKCVAVTPPAHAHTQAKPTHLQ